MTQTIIKPKRLKKGDTIGLIAPASPRNEDEQVRISVETLQSLGFNVKEGAHVYCRHGYLAGTDEERAADLNAMFADSRVDGIITTNGGYGSSRLLPVIDYDNIRRNPKVLLGYSDITALLNAIFTRTGLVTFHGPIAGQDFTPYTLAEFKKVLMEGEKDILLGAPPAFEGAEGHIERKNRIQRYGTGKPRGRLVGGNLSLLAHLVGTPYSPDYTDKIVFIEDVGESTYRVDRMLTQLWLSGDLERAAGLAFGKFTDCLTNASWSKQLTLEEVIEDRIRRVNRPSVRGLMIGHIEDQTTIPVGCEAELDVDAGTLTLLEASVL